MTGQCRLTLQEYRDRQVPETGYLFRKEFRHRGYAAEAAMACKHYAFGTWNYDEVFSIIRDTNTVSQRVALRSGMSAKDRVVKHYYGTDMPHPVFSVRRV